MMRIVLCAGLIFAASAAENPRFETVSIAPNRSGIDAYSGHLQMTPEPVTLILHNVSLKFCVQQAYSLKEYQVSGPGWIKSRKYDITTTLAPGTPLEQVWPALQTLLAERFKLAIRRERKELPVYSLTIAQDGPKLHATAGGYGGPLEFQPGSRRDRIGDRSGQSASGTLRLRNGSIAKFCAELSRYTNRPVLDSTGIAGTFDFELRYGKNGDTSAPISTALQQQLGLKLEPGKAAVDLLIIEKAVQP
jgi:uncharacterized protein (TIGR03435 family)